MTKHELHVILRTRDLETYTGLRRTQIEELIAQGRFPRKIKLSARRVGFLASEVAAWQAERIRQGTRHDSEFVPVGEKGLQNGEK